MNSKPMATTAAPTLLVMGQFLSNVARYGPPLRSGQTNRTINSVSARLRKNFDDACKRSMSAVAGCESKVNTDCAHE